MMYPVHNRSGQVVGEKELPEELFGVPFHEGVVHQALVRQLANARRGTADTKTRGEVAYSTRKLHPQKHTGHARQGSRKAPHQVGGGVAFGPHPRSYAQRLPKKMRRLALRCLFSAKARERELVLLEELKMEAPRTKQIKDLLSALELSSSVLILTPEVDYNIYGSARNLPRVKVLPAVVVSVRDLLSYKNLVLPLAALDTVEGIWGARKPAGAEA